ncbi:MAG: M43 family zinc metalloprotease [Flavobacteriales bacterium]|nr:M43 family zinc metalloprotease [Flavobacteriales bacterium]
MKKLSLVIVVLLNVFFANAQQRNCGTMQHLDEIRERDPGVDNRMDVENLDIKHWISNNTSSSKSMPNLITIPVVVHVIYKNSSQNISDAQIFSQIDILNEDFRMNNSDASSVPSAFAGVAADCEIEFCLAVRDPNGNVTTGITRTYTTTSSFSGYTSMKYSSTGGQDAWNTSDYLNIWVCNLASGLLGFATFPGGNSSTDGVVCDYAYFGNTGTATSPYDLGRTATHEVGHWLNLYHIWGDSYCGNDYVSDTPKHEESNYGCPSYPHASSCSGTGSSGEMFMNYMDYTNDACMFMFSTGQKNRMRATLNGSRSSLLSSLGCQVVYPPIILSSTTTNLSCSLANDGSINLSAIGGVSPLSYVWSNGSTTQDISNLSSGYYNVTVTDAVGQTESSTFYISEPSPIIITYSVNSTSQAGFSDGSIFTTVSGGTAPYSFSWQGPNGYSASTQDIQNLIAGTYIFYVIDDNGCSELFSIVVGEGQLTPLQVNAVTSDIDCFGNNNGSINLTVSDGATPYSFIWNNGAITEDLSNLAAGTYTVVVNDAAGQSFTSSYTIIEPSEITATYTVTNVTTSGGNDGAIDLIASGGVAPYLYYWSTSPTQTTEDISNLIAGTYTVWIVDVNNCYIGVDIDVVEDLSNQSCSEDAPANLLVSDIISTRATINWDNMNSSVCVIDQYRIRYRELGTTAWIQKTMGAPLGSCSFGNQRVDKLLLNLTPSTQYEYQMKAWYCGGGSSAWTALHYFTTTDDCPLIANLSATPQNPTKVKFDWTLNGTYSFVRIKIREDYTSASWVNVGGAGVSYPAITKNKNGLIPGETYRGQARTWCDPNGGAYNSTSWTNLVFWTMPSSARISFSAEKELLKVTDLLGRELNPNTVIDNTTLLYIYIDGTVEKRVVIE